MKNTDSQTNSFIELTDEDLKLLYNYPNLGKVFDSKEDLEKMRERLKTTYQDLERVIRQGTKEDADKATKAAQSIKVTLNLLDTIEEILVQQNTNE
jgi:uncharacterized protein (DUF2225 family)